MKIKLMTITLSLVFLLGISHSVFAAIPATATINTPIPAANDSVVLSAKEAAEYKQLKQQKQKQLQKVKNHHRYKVDSSYPTRRIHSRARFYQYPRIARQSRTVYVVPNAPVYVRPPMVMAPPSMYVPYYDDYGFDLFEPERVYVPVRPSCPGIVHQFSYSVNL